MVSDFDRHFRRHVVPALKRRARRLAKGVAQGRWSYAAALDGLCREALRRGAVWLSDFTELEDFLATELANLAEHEIEKG